jgi:TolB-like protein
MTEEAKGHDTGAEATASGVDAAAVTVAPDQDRVLTLWRQLKQHRIAQWSVGYIAVAYGIQHAVTLTSEAFEWPNLVVRISMLILILGLPVAMTLAWYHGERASRRISGPELTIISILLVVASIVFFVLVRPPEQIAARPIAVAQTATAVAPVAPAAKPAGISVAVLPFLNLSGDPKEEYFSDGMTEEITSALAKIPSLPVVGRTSAFAFKGKNEDLGAIGQALHATYVLEGSVRKDGNEVRITAQLIKAATGDHVWTDSYDRNLKGIFAVQEDVAKAIAAALQVPLGLKQGESLVSYRNIDPASHQDYLRAVALFRARSLGTALTAPIALLKQVVARQPNYAPAWALLAQIYAFSPSYNTSDGLHASVKEMRSVVDESFPKAEAAARRAIELDPRNADAYAALGQIQKGRTQLVGAEQSFKQALSLDPLNPETLHLYSEFLAETGRIKEAVAMREQLRSLEPLVPTFNDITVVLLLAAGDNTQGLAIAKALPSDFGPRADTIAAVYAAMKKYKEAADAMLDAPRDIYPPGAVETAARLLSMAPASAMQQNIPDLGELSFVLVYVGLPERALEFNEHLADAGYYLTNFDVLWSSDYAVVRKTQQFKALVRKMGLVDYWRAKGWPQWCHPTTGDDFECS